MLDLIFFVRICLLPIDELSFTFSYCSLFAHTESQVCVIQQTDAVPADSLSSRNADETFSFHVAWFHIICTHMHS